jgi:hypothetical protein
VFDLLFFLLTDELAEHWGAALPCLSAANDLIALYLCHLSSASVRFSQLLKGLNMPFLMAMVLLWWSTFGFNIANIGTSNVSIPSDSIVSDRLRTGGLSISLGSSFQLRVTPVG